MSVKGLNELVGRGCISDNFRVGLLNGQRAELIRQPEFQLEPDEAKAVLAIQADNFVDFAVAVERLVGQRASRAGRAEGAFRAPVRWPSVAITGVYLRQQR
jgi:hypothetical protein